MDTPEFGVAEVYSLPIHDFYPGRARFPASSNSSGPLKSFCILTVWGSLESRFINQAKEYWTKEHNGFI